FFRLLLLWVRPLRGANQNDMDSPDRCSRKDVLAVIDRSGIERSSVGEYGNRALDDGLAVITDMSGNSGVFRRRLARATGCQQQHHYPPPRTPEVITWRCLSMVIHLEMEGTSRGTDGWRPSPYSDH